MLPGSSLRGSRLAKMPISSFSQRDENVVAEFDVRHAFCPPQLDGPHLFPERLSNHRLRLQIIPKKLPTSGSTGWG
jgi:hypothetical protein